MYKNKTLVMIVDDEPAMCSVLKRIVTGEGYKVITAGDGQEALTLNAKHQPDAVLLDLMMPGMSGQDVCSRIKESSPTTRVIYFTAKMMPMQPSEKNGSLGKADAFISKPATSQKILSVIREVLC